MIRSLLLTAVIAATVSAAITWNYQSSKYENKISDIKTEYLKAQFKAVEKAHAETIRLQEQKDNAEKQAQKRQAALLADVKSSRNALTRVSDAADAAIRAAQESHSSCVANASTLRIVFGQCTARLVEVGKDAQGHLEDKRTLVESWPDIPE